MDFKSKPLPCFRKASLSILVESEFGAAAAPIGRVAFRAFCLYSVRLELLRRSRRLRDCKFIDTVVGSWSAPPPWGLAAVWSCTKQWSAAAADVLCEIGSTRPQDVVVGCLVSGQGLPLLKYTDQGHSTWNCKRTTVPQNETLNLKFIAIG